MKRYICLLLLFIRLTIHSAEAQNIRLYGSGEYQAGEMSCNLVNSICQDTQGFIWIATEYGLNKFGGNTFIPYLSNESNSNSLLGNNVRKLMLDKDSTLWIACTNGLQNFDPVREIFRNVQFPEHLQPHVSDVIRLRSGELYIVTSGQGLFRLKKGSWNAERVDEINQLLKQNYFSCIFEDIHGNIWIGSSNGTDGLLRYNPVSRKSRVFYSPEISNNFVTDILEDHSGQLYVGTAGTVDKYNPVSDSFIHLHYVGAGPFSSSQMMLSHNGYIYVGTNGGGLKYIDIEKGEIRSVENENIPPNMDMVSIPALMEDRDNNLWMGCFQVGILMLPNEHTQFNFRNFSGNGFKMGSFITSICKDYAGNLWCGVNKGGIVQLNAAGKEIRRFPELWLIRKIFEDSEHTLWVANERTLGKFDRNTGKYTKLPIIKGGFFIKTIVEDQHKNLYISVFGNGFVRYSLLTGKCEEFNEQVKDAQRGDIPNQAINSILCDSRGLVWLGHYLGLSCYDPKSDRYVKIGPEEALTKQICLSLIEDQYGHIWAGTYNGLFCIDIEAKTATKYTTGDGLSNNVICGLAESEDGDIWCSTFNGINQIKRKENRIINYFTGNGLVDKIYNRGAYFTDKDGIVYFGGNKGVTWFSPKEIHSTENYGREVLLTGIYLHNQKINFSAPLAKEPVIVDNPASPAKLRFSYEDNSFSLEFSVMDFIAPENILYEYRLKELSGEWSQTHPGINRITYNYLSPGKYTLEVRARKLDSYSPVKQFRLIVSPPWYKSVWAYMIYAFIAIAVCLLVFYTIDKKRKEEINEAKLRFFIDVSHEIRSPMTLIINPLEKLLKNDYDTATARALEIMHRNARYILGLINQILDVRKIDKGRMQIQCSETDLVGFINNLYEVFEDQANRRNIKFVFEHPIEELRVWIDHNNFDKVLMNLLSNAFKYTPDNGEITILLTSGINNESWGPLRHYAEIRVLDTGQGIDEDKIEKIFTRFYQAHNELTFSSLGSGIGLNLSRNLIELHQGTIIAVNRKDGQGSCFTVRIPLGKEHIKKENMAKKETQPQSSTEKSVFIQENAKKKTIRSKTNYKLLIVDDDPEIRNFLKQELEETYKIVTAANGKEGLQTVLSQMPDLIITDVVMPEMDGFTFVKKLKTNSNVSHIPVIILSSKAEFENRIEGLDKGGDAYLTKPFNIEELTTLIKNLLNSRQVLKGKFSVIQDQKEKVKITGFKSSDENLMERIFAIINADISDSELNVESLATKIGLSRTQLHRKIKELTGIPVSDFIRNIRLEKAAELLKEKKMNVSQIAYAVGFTNQRHFSTAFKKYYGISPTEYILR